MNLLKLFVGTLALVLTMIFFYITTRAFMLGMFTIGFMSVLIVFGMGHLSYSMMIDLFED